MPGAMARDERVRADTRDVVICFLALARSRSAIGRHRLASWPPKF